MSSVAERANPPASSEASGKPPPRPQRHSMAVCRRAAEMMTKQLAEWLEEKALDERALDQVAEALRYDHDGYGRARHLESRYYWSPNSELVEILDNDALYGAHEEAEREWVKLTGATVPLPDGAKVETGRHGVGEITGRYVDRATYIVWNESCHGVKAPNTGLVLAAETCTPVVEAS